MRRPSDKPLIGAQIISFRGLPAIRASLIREVGAEDLARAVRLRYPCRTYVWANPVRRLQLNLRHMQ